MKNQVSAKEAHKDEVTRLLIQSYDKGAYKLCSYYVEVFGFQVGRADKRVSDFLKAEYMAVVRGIQDQLPPKEFAEGKTVDLTELGQLIQDGRFCEAWAILRRFGFHMDREDESAIMWRFVADALSNILGMDFMYLNDNPDVPDCIGLCVNLMEMPFSEVVLKARPYLSRLGVLRIEIIFYELLRRKYPLSLGYDI